jgi:hypothetical protein
MNKAFVLGAAGRAFLRRSRQLPWREMAKLGIVAVLPQISTLLWLVTDSSSFYFRGWFNLEYFLLLSLALLYPSVLMVALLTTELTIALIEPIGHLYYFSLADTVISLRYLLLIPSSRLALYACLLVVYVGGCAALLRLGIGNKRPPGAVPMVRFLLLSCLVAVVVTMASDPMFGRLYLRPIIGRQMGDVDLRKSHVVCMPGVSLINAMLHIDRGFRPGQEDDAPRLPLRSALSEALAGLRVGSRPDVVLVLTESWGLATDEPLNQAMIEPYDSNPALKKLYSIQTGSVPFLGGTTSGETRELCGDSLGRSQSVPPGYFSHCWPMRLESAGYRTLAVHGFTPTLFGRGEWYRQFGFQQTEFLPELERDGSALCDGAFPGACDADVAHWIGTQLLGNSTIHPMFVYWVTLNSHLPVSPIKSESTSSDCVAARIDGDQGLCSWFIYALRVQRSVVRLALAPGLRPTLFVVVGDHAPPFLNPSRRNRFSQTSVPYVLLIPEGDRLTRWQD